MSNSKTKTTKIDRERNMEGLAAAAECLRILAHPVRLRIVQLLLHDRYTGFFTSEREGRRVYYQVAEPHLERILDCVESRFLS